MLVRHGRETGIESRDEEIQPQAKSEADAVLVLLGMVDDPAALASRVEALSSGDEGATLTIVDRLSRVANEASASVLQAVADHEGFTRSVRKQARRALHRLRGLGIHLPPRAVVSMVARPETPELRQSWASRYDGTGARMLHLLVERGQQGSKIVDIVLNHREGILDATAEDGSQRKYQSRLADLRQSDARADFVALPNEYSRQLVDEALALRNRQGVTALSRAQAMCIEIVGVPERPLERALVYERISPVEVKLQPDLLADSGQLILSPDFLEWRIAPADLVGHLEAVVAAQESRVTLTGESREERMKRALTTATRALFTEQVRLDFKRRLEETAHLLLEKGRLLDARRAVAVAVELGEHRESRSTSILLRPLAPAAGRGVEEIPFVRALVAASIQWTMLALAEQASREGVAPPEPAI